ncbi:hypothetical protein AALP_AAs46730U000200 [Arabis alpina]|uniref:RRM domain-containing protein n=1 Tax=Arabis alpina TaxID=50452 RepID=A0A087G065_ARAAL|nr:hypothetical protein AALP_AAs46730U000200 [Arabis alpina]
MWKVAIVNRHGKRKSEDDLETKTFMKKHKEQSEEKDTMKGVDDGLLLETKSDQDNLISVKAFQEKNGEYLHDCKIVLEVAKKGATYLLPKSDYNLRKESLPFEQNEKPPNVVEEVLFVANLSPQTKTSHMASMWVMALFNLLLLTMQRRRWKRRMIILLLNHMIILHVAKKTPYPPRPKYNLAEKLCYEDYFRLESHLIEEDETVEGLDQSPDFVEAIAIRKRTLFIINIPSKSKISDMYEDYLLIEEEEDEAVKGLEETLDCVKEVDARKKTFFVANLSPRTKISDIIEYFEVAGEVVCVSLIVNHKGKHVGCGFVEFASAKEANKALELRYGEPYPKFFLDVVKAAPYPLLPKYNLAEKLW